MSIQRDRISKTKSDIRAANLRLTWDDGTLALTVRSGRQTWRFAPASPRSLCVTSGGNEIAVSLSDAKARTTPLANGALEGVVCRLERFRGLPPDAELEIVLTAVVEIATGELVFSLDGRSRNLTLQCIYWPGEIRFEDAAEQETVIPFMQGVIIPGRWDHEIPARDHRTNGRLYMPWWAQRRGTAGYIAILETDADGGFHLQHPVGGPTRIAPRWDGSLGEIGYRRSIRYAFFERCDHVSLCKHYRRYLISRGRFVSLREKIQAAPRVGLLLGCPVIHVATAHNIHPLSHYYDKQNPAKNRQCIPFAVREQQLRKLKALGIRRAYVHLDGWGVDGYDSHHPDYLPPHAGAGGWAGLRQLADTCRRLGYLLALHDQYRDYYHNAASFNPEHAIRDDQGQVPYWHTWYGGPQSVLCASFAPAYVLCNHLALQDHGVAVAGTYLDVFASVHPDQCFHPEHRMTRRQCMEHRIRCFAAIADLEGIVSSEEPADFAVPHLHLVHHGPHATFEWVSGSKAEMPAAPLWSLVYHDALLLPWLAHREPGGWGIPAADRSVAHCALNAGMPYLDIQPSRKDVAGVKRLCALQRRVAFEEMVRHEFLDERHTLQKTVFADGTTVVADLATGAWQVRQST